MCFDFAFYCVHKRKNNIQEKKEMSDSAIRHSLKICPIIYENNLRELLNLELNPHAKKFEYNDPLMRELIVSIQELINHLEKNDSKDSEQELVDKAIQKINNEDARSLKDKIKNAFVEGGLAGIDKATDNIIVATILGVIRGFRGQ